MKNKFSGRCRACGKQVPVGTGILEFIHKYPRGRYELWCLSCFNESDNSGPEDRCCGDRAYEDQCARACGFDNY